MLDIARKHFDVMERLADPLVASGLLNHFDMHTGRGVDSSRHLLLRGNILRRCGRLMESRAVLNAFAREKGIGEIPDPDALCHPGLESEPGFVMAPLIVIDDFLPANEMDRLYRRACALEKEFVLAPSNRHAIGYDPDTRETLVHPQFDEADPVMRAFVGENLLRMQRAFGLPRFDLDAIETKLTCHRDGGFFVSHADNHKLFGETGRAITCVYYLGRNPPQHRGGELRVIDTSFPDQGMAENWFTTVAPTPNRFVAFPSWFNHAVSPSRVPENRFEDARFAVSCHVLKPADGQTWL